MCQSKKRFRQILWSFKLLKVHLCTAQEFGLGLPDNYSRPTTSSKVNVTRKGEHESSAIGFRTIQNGSKWYQHRCWSLNISTWPKHYSTVKSSVAHAHSSQSVSNALLDSGVGLDATCVVLVHIGGLAAYRAIAAASYIASVMILATIERSNCVCINATLYCAPLNFQRGSACKHWLCCSW